MNKYTLEAARNAGAQEIKNQKAAKAKRIVMGTDAHLRGLSSCAQNRQRRDWRGGRFSEPG
jgi:hypothetical protein